MTEVPCVLLEQVEQDPLKYDGDIGVATADLVLDLR